MLADRIVLDSGPVIAFSRGDIAVRLALERAAEAGMDIIVVPAVVTQTIRGGGRDAPLHRLLGACLVPPVDLQLARLAGELLGRTGGSDVADAQLAAEAITGQPCAILTGDPKDIGALVGGHPSVRVVAV
ncbi:MAG: PIN domain-containing protein [Chloroflexota bacterium]|nr:PIN domain-containing protein [Chloroflexota bacterium]